MTVKPKEKDPSYQELTAQFLERLENGEGLVLEVIAENASTAHGVEERAQRESWRDWARYQVRSLLP